MSREITVFEFDDISVGDGDKQLCQSDFDELKRFILSAQDESEETVNGNEFAVLRDASACMTLGAKNGREVIRVKNYVGIVSLKSGTTIEILPKIAYNSSASDVEFSREAVVEMLRASGIISYKSFQRASLEAHRRMNLYEVFIRLFLDELNDLYKRGLKAGYVCFEENENYLKGKLLLSEHIKRNFAHKEKFYVEYDVFDFNRPENRLIKSTLLYLNSKSREQRNRRDIRRMISILDEINASENYDSDFRRCECGRVGKDYKDVLEFCKIFLAKKSFTMYRGKHDATAMLFPMNILFEKYVAKEMSKSLADDWTISCQDESYYLFECGRGGRFPLRPDIVVRNNAGETVIIDTKWKRLNADPTVNYGISQTDMYQMYAYHTRYVNTRAVVLLYPFCGSIGADKYETKVFGQDVTIYVRQFDLRGYIEKQKSGNGNFWQSVIPEINVSGGLKNAYKKF